MPPVTTTTTTAGRSSRSTAKPLKPTYEFYAFDDGQTNLNSPAPIPIPVKRRPSTSSKPSFEYSYSYNYGSRGSSVSSSSSSPEPHVQHHPEPAKKQQQQRPSRSASTSASTRVGAEPSSFGYHGFAPAPEPKRPSAQDQPQTTSTKYATMPSRSRSTSSSYDQRHRSPSPAPPPPIPANAFNIMHEWEIESLEKWQRRLERVRSNQIQLRSKIDGLLREERDLWDSYRQGGGGDKKKMAGEYAEWVAFLEEEVTTLRKELEGTVEAAEKAEKGVRKATARLEEIRTLGGRWRTGVTNEEAGFGLGGLGGRSRSGSESSSAASGAKAPSRSATPAPDHRSRPARPTRSNTDPFPGSSYSSRNPSPSTSPKPSRSSQSTRSASPSTTLPRGRPLQPSSQKSSLNPWLAYEDKWHQLLTNNNMSLTFKTIPWPMSTPPTRPEDLKVASIKAFVLSSNAVHLHPMVTVTTEVGKEQQQTRQRRAVLRAAILRWHPDKFLGKYLGMVVEEEREMVKEGVEMVIRSELFLTVLSLDDADWTLRLERDYAYGSCQRAVCMNAAMLLVRRSSSLYNPSSDHAHQSSIIAFPTNLSFTHWRRLSVLRSIFAFL